MFKARIMFMGLAAGGILAAQPASAQFFLKSPDLSGAPVTGAEPGMTGPAMPNATPDELRAALVWNLRAALNVAALQCQFEPTLLTVTNYNAILRDHAVELRNAYQAVEKYFQREAKGNKKLGTTEHDRYNTRVYAGFSTISAQYTFCQTAGSIGHQALFLNPGQLGNLAQNRMRELRASLSPAGEQQFPRGYHHLYRAAPALPPFGDVRCWTKRSVYDPKKCGPLSPTVWRPAAVVPPAAQASR